MHIYSALIHLKGKINVKNLVSKENNVSIVLKKTCRIEKTVKGREKTVVIVGKNVVCKIKN